jgi:rhodanese-related sulfurtransferase
MVQQITAIHAQQPWNRARSTGQCSRNFRVAVGAHPSVAPRGFEPLRNGVKALLPRDTVIFVCAAGTRSNMAAQLALAAGLREVYNLSGGVRAWKDAGLCLQKPRVSATG